MFNFSRLTQLNEHTTRLQSQMNTDDFYLVGGVVRDLLLGIDKSIVDVDITGPHHPDVWRDMIDKSNISTFRTEKFGTMTMVRTQAEKGGKRLKNAEKVLLIHGWGNQPGDDACLTGVAEALKKGGYEVIFEHYNYADETDVDLYLTKICAHDVDVVIGHSAGAYLALQYAQVKSVSQVICVAPTTPTSANSDQFNQSIVSWMGEAKAQEFFAFHDRRIDASKISASCHFVYGAKDDIIDLDVQNYYKQILPRASVDVLSDRGHMGVDEGNPVVAELNEIIIQQLNYGGAKKGFSENWDDVIGENQITNRDVVDAIVYDIHTKKYIVIQQTGTSWQKFMGGGVDDGEDLELAILREIEEELGFISVASLRQIGETVFAKYFHPSKQKYIQGNVVFFYCEVDSREKQEISLEEQAIQEILYLSKEEVDNFINIERHQYFWRLLQSDIDNYQGIGSKLDSSLPGRTSDAAHSEGQTIYYEITPFRCEGGYEDFRHPGEIQWSTSLLDDAKRRDFTINCLYYKKLKAEQQGIPEKGKSGKLKAENIEKLDSSLHSEGQFDPEKYVKQGYRYDEASGTLCVCDHEFIQDIEENEVKIGGRLGEIVGLNDEDIIHLIIDPYQGLVDLREGTLRCVGDADHRMQEDALRILRGLRFVNTLNQMSPRGDTLLISQIQWDFHRETWRSMQKYHFLVQHLAKERIKQEITKVFSMKNPFGYVALLDELKLLPLIFPSVAKIKGLEQPVRYHPLDTYHHTLMTLWHLQKINDNYLVKLAMLYHDVGKVEQYKLYGIGLTKDEISIVHGSWLNHTVCGPDFVRRDFAVLGFSNAEIDHIAWLVQYHMYPGQILMAKPDNQIKKLRTLLAESSYEKMCDLIDVVEGDRLGHYNPLQSQAELDGPQQLRIMLDKIYHDEGQITLSSLQIDGQVLMDSLNLQPGKVLGKLLQKCLEYVLSDPHRNTKEELVKFAKKEIKKLI